MRLGQANFEYKGDRKKTESNRCGEYFTVGDVGYLNGDGYLFLCARKADMIISGGVNQLARMEARVAFEELLARIPAYELASEPRWPRSTWARAYRAAPTTLLEDGDLLLGGFFAVKRYNIGHLR